MSWISSLLHKNRNSGELFDLDSVLSAGMRDRVSARKAVAILKKQRSVLERERHAINGKFGRVTPGQIRRIARSSSGNPQIEAFQLTDAMRNANDVQSGSELSEELAAIDGQIHAIGRAVNQLEVVAH